METASLQRLQISAAQETRVDHVPKHAILPNRQSRNITLARGSTS
jgi:hypothetical protein